MKLNVTILPANITIAVPYGTNVLEAIRKAKVPFAAVCGGKGRCGKCLVEEVSGLAPATKREKKILKEQSAKDGMRLACQARIVKNATVIVPAARGMAESKAGLKGEEIWNIAPRFSLEKLEIPKASASEPASLTCRLKKALAEKGKEDVEISLDLLRRIATMSSDRIAVLIEGNRLVDVLEGDCEKPICGLALDIGTTTMVGYLVELSSGRQLSVAAMENPQASFGSDILSRISSIRRKPENLQVLHQLLINGVNELIERVTDAAGVSREFIYDLVAVGNTCMIHFFLGISPQSLAVAPYHAVLEEAIEVRAPDLKIAINKNGLVRTLPIIRSFVGADTVGAILGSGMPNSRNPTLLIDIGTNGEIVLKTKNEMAACSAAAGPAFEGARILYGMRATAGAIDHVRVGDGSDFEIHTINGLPPKGICGSGLIDAIYASRLLGLMDGSGRILPKESVPGPLRHRVVPWGKGRAIVLTQESETEAGQPIILTQQDIRQVQLAKGAIRAGIEILMRELGLTINSLDRIILAGAFGSYISRESARGIGLIPPLPLDRIVSVGNAAGEGAKMALLSKDAYAESLMLARKVKYIPLSGREDFLRLYLKEMHFPEPPAF
ncbi:MAG: DUF4445 domain-containing protein [Firmicutes bacterium]|nr:DUF4445 domain-containing protein [Bacillota bacterium]